MFATSSITRVESEDEGQTEQVEDGKCSRAWMESDLRRARLGMSVSWCIIYRIAQREKLPEPREARELTTARCVGTQQYRVAQMKLSTIPSVLRNDHMVQLNQHTRAL